jgi:hypothetical protein
MLTQEYLKSVLNYDPETGIFTWLINASSRARIGDVAGCIFDNRTKIQKSLGGKPDYRRRIRIKGKMYYSNVLAWLYMTGEFPNALVDHCNVDSLDDRWINLRHATIKQNGKNKKIFINNKSGFKGVSKLAKKNKWQVHIRVDGKRMYLGHYDCIAAAAFSYQIASDKYHGKFGREV